MYQEKFNIACSTVCHHCLGGTCRGGHHRNLSASSARRKRALMLFLHNTKQRLLRLLIVVKWANKVPSPHLRTITPMELPVLQ